MELGLRPQIMGTANAGAERQGVGRVARSRCSTRDESSVGPPKKLVAWEGARSDQGRSGRPTLHDCGWSEGAKTKPPE